MSDVLLLFCMAAALAAILANIGIWSPRRLWIKISALIVVALFLPVSYAGFAELLSRPKPVALEWIQHKVPEAAVLGSRMVEDEAIYLWLAFEDQDEPRAYTLPWTEEAAKQLHEAQRNAEANGTTVRVKMPFEPSHDKQERKFYAEPHRAPPAKQADGGGTMQFRGSNGAANATSK